MYGCYISGIRAKVWVLGTSELWNEENNGSRSRKWLIESACSHTYTEEKKSVN